MSSTPFNLAKARVFVIKRPCTHTLFSIDTRGTTPATPRSILVFETKNLATEYSRLIRSCDPAGRKNNHPAVEDVPLESIRRRCGLNALGLLMMSEAGDGTRHLAPVPSVDYDLDSIVFHLENTARWYDNFMDM